MVHSSSKVRLAAALSALLFVALLALEAWALVRAPRLGVTLRWQASPDAADVAAWTVTSVMQDTPLQVGDRILRVGDIAADRMALDTDNTCSLDLAAFQDWLAMKATLIEQLVAPVVPLLVERDDSTVTLLVKPKRAGLGVFLQLGAVHLLVAVVFLAVGLLVLERCSARPDTLAFGAFAATMAFLLETQAAGVLAEVGYEAWVFRLFNWVNLLAYIAAPMVLFHLSLLLPQPRAFLRRWGRSLSAMYAGVSVGLLFAPFRFLDGSASVFLALALGNVVYGFVTADEALEKQGMKWVLAALVVGVGPWLVCDGVPALLGGERILPDAVPSAASVVVPVGFAFAIARYRLLDVDALFRGTLVQVATVLTLAVVDLGVLALLSTQYGQMLDLGTAGNTLASLFLALALYAPVRDALSRFARRMSHRDVSDVSDALEILAARASGKSKYEVLEAFQRTVHDFAGPAYARWLEPASDPELAALEGTYEAVPAWERPEERGRSRTDVDSYVLLPFHGEARLLRVLALGAPPAEAFYSRSTMRLLTALLREAETLFENARLFEDSVEQSRQSIAQELRHLAEREAILRELHDGLGGIATGIALLAEAGIRKSGEGAARETLSTVSRLAREHVEEIRSFMQDLDAPAVSFRALATDIGRLGNRMLAPHGVALTMETQITDEGPRPDAFLDYHVRRAAKECFTNVVKHAHARAVQVVVRVTAETFTLTVEDDGVGMPDRDFWGRGIGNMRRRAEMMGGTMTVVLANGTLVCFTLPLAAERRPTPLPFAAAMRKTDPPSLAEFPTARPSRPVPASGAFPARGGSREGFLVKLPSSWRSRS